MSRYFRNTPHTWLLLSVLQVDHTQDWKDFGAITKLNLFYSWNYGCLQGIKATYGYKAGNARIIGHEKNLYTQVGYPAAERTTSSLQWKLDPVDN